MHCIAPGGDVLDLACGTGRHSRLLAEQGFRVCAVDRDSQAIRSLDGIKGVTVQVADLENEPWPLADRRFDGVIVTRYLHRPLFPRIVGAVAPGGVLIYETFAAGNERFGKPSNPDFLLQAGELLEIVRGRLQVIAYENIELASPRPAKIQRICAQGFSAAGEMPSPRGIG